MTTAARKLAALILILLMSIGSIVLWIGIPLGWIVLASHMTDTAAPTLGPYLLVLFGIPVTMFLFGRLLGRLNAMYGAITGTAPEVEWRPPWLKSMRGERDTPRPSSMLDVVMIASVTLALIAFAIWFFAFAGSSLPGS
jgi:hypothetical protein